MTAEEVLKYEADLHAYAERLEAQGHEWAVKARTEANACSRWVAQKRHEAAMIELQQKAAGEIRIVLNRIEDVAKSVEENHANLDTVATWAEGNFVEQASMVTDTHKRIEKAEREEVAKAAVVETKHVISDKLGRPVRIETRHDGRLVSEKVITYGTTGVMTGRIVDTIERPVTEKQHPENPFIR